MSMGVDKILSPWGRIIIAVDKVVQCSESEWSIYTDQSKFQGGFFRE